MALETEIQAIQQSFQALQDLDKGAKKRVIDWLISKFDLLNITPETIEQVVKEPVPAVQPQPVAQPVEVSAPVVVPEVVPVEPPVVKAPKKEKIADFGSVAELFAAVKPKRRGDKALVVAAFMQEKEGMEEVGGQRINRELKQVNEASSNITIDINSLAHKGFVFLTRKDGPSQQARKNYRVTAEGIARVHDLMKKTK